MANNLNSTQIALLKNELQTDPYSLGYSAYFLTTDLDSLIALLSFTRDGITPCPNNNIIGGPSGTITAASNATPIVITSTAHGLNTGDGVVISGVLGNLGANGTWVITKINNNTFSLNTSVGSGAYVSGGTWHWCVAGVRNSFITTQQLLGSIAVADLITNNISAAITADQMGKLLLLLAICGDGQIALTNPDGSDNNNAKTLKQVVSNPSISRTTIINLETRNGSRLEMLLSLSGMTPTEDDIRAALS